MKSESFSYGKALFAAFLLAVVFWAVADQCGALEYMSNVVETGKAGATVRGMVR